MTKFKILTFIFAATLSVECNRIHHKRETLEKICDPQSSKIQCFCSRDQRNGNIVRSADCYLVQKDLSANDTEWEGFKDINRLERLIVSNSRGAPLKYIPTRAFEHVPGLEDINIKYGDIKEVLPFAFNNMSNIREIILSQDHIETLHRHAFYHHRRLAKITLDGNHITEINRDVFVELPHLEELFLTNNKITTLHDKAFIHLIHLTILELDKNKIFSLNSETFSGLKKLKMLELSGNNLQVIGDNTFLPLEHLETLDLQDNQIEMLDMKAFKGLTKLKSLSLARNKLTVLDSNKIFDGLTSLISLNLKSNNISVLKEEVMTPIIENFYNETNNFEFDDNQFPCACNLDWLLMFRNKTKNTRLQLSIENLKCIPDEGLMEKWNKQMETAKSDAELDEAPTQNSDYEYYDETQLNGKILFYVDIRDLLNCTAKVYLPPLPEPVVTSTKSPFSVTKPIVEAPLTKTTQDKIKNKGTLDLSVDEIEPSTTQSVKIHFPVSNDIVKNDEKQKSFTTSRLATVSAKPIESLKNENEGMASDEASPPDAHRHQRYSHEAEETKASNANNLCEYKALTIPILTLFYRLV